MVNGFVGENNKIMEREIEKEREGEIVRLK